MSNQWIIPCNVSTFNIIDHFQAHDKMLWKGTSHTNVGDIVYLYVTRPVCAIKYKCHVTRTNIDFHEILESPYDLLKTRSKMRKNYIEIEKETYFEDNTLSFSALKNNGLKSVQSQCRVPDSLVLYIDSYMESFK